jgi:hypothetical protein
MLKPSWLLSPVNDLGYWHWSESGLITELVVIQGAESPAKTVTSLLIIPTVLGLVQIFSSDI